MCVTVAAFLLLWLIAIFVLGQCSEALRSELHVLGTPQTQEEADPTLKSYNKETKAGKKESSSIPISQAGRTEAQNNSFF